MPTTLAEPQTRTCREEKDMMIREKTLHKAVLKMLDSMILSEGEVFTIALMAAARKFDDMTSFDQLQAALRR
jgi:hypothetical protein